MVRRPQTKGKVERFIGHVGNHFLPLARESGLASIRDLNQAVNRWLDEINEEPIRAFCESRNERFAREKTHFIPFVPEAAPDVREDKTVLVSCEGTIVFETNRYSVPARYLGQALTLRYHPLTREAALYAKDTVVRSFSLLPKGARKTDVREEDRRELLELWHRQRQGGGTRPLTRKKTSPQVQVEVRSPAWYESLLGELAV